MRSWLISLPAGLGATETVAMLWSGYWSRRCSSSREPNPEPLERSVFGGADQGRGQGMGLQRQR